MKKKNEKSKCQNLLEPSADRPGQQILVLEPGQLARQLDPVRERRLVEQQRHGRARLVPVGDARRDAEERAERAARDGVDGRAEAGAGRGRGAGLGEEVVDEAAADVVAPAFLRVGEEEAPEGRG